MDKNTLIKMVSKLEDKVLVSRLLDKVEQCRYSSFVYSDFLSPYEAAIAKRILGKVSNVSYIFIGGYEGAERVIAFISTDFTDEEDAYLKMPLSFLRIKHTSDKQLSHRDYLGSLLGLGIKREKIGDILVCESFADVFIIDKIAEYVLYNLDKIGNVRVSCETLNMYEYTAPQKKEKLINTTVASLRADSVSACGFGVSRTKITDYFKAQRVNVNWELVQNPSKLLSEGDTISIRGKGRIVLDKVAGTTKKDRVNIIIKRFE
ncbi:RNA-binding protein YlmH [Ruminiclostridium sufflavum DSM 19573]|uniref:RNA-binding protein YlmH n=1 Tax=Ruminiclostridium sufflavum DSM 19573 TaxID=1121337 RepID=A0A318XR02_9FIRM|nr:YlmH/Sll1252 family protein [Ruminiclostridium sufflavum]PYG89898.1 RNA-binding protein YlmH [Ruminiclostridium sufflavum DSM 19573]